jgi:formylglycine-generating enzyme required for sulfatase activity
MRTFCVKVINDNFKTEKRFVILCVILLIFGVFLYYQNRNKEIKTQFNPIDSAEMVWVPAGYFTMGNSDFLDGPNLVTQQHKVYLDGYWIYRYEVTVKQYHAFCNATHRKMPIINSFWDEQGNFPISCVSWDDAVSYAKWAGCNLPTEAEWEKAARGTDRRKFPWGSKWDTNKCVNSWKYDISYPQPVGSLHDGDSPYGVSDMAGNVSEWCLDWFNFSYYKISQKKNPPGPNSGIFKVIRGGAWNLSGGDWNSPKFFSTYFRADYQKTKFKSSGVGFRCVKH